MVRIVSESSIAAGVRRIEAITGKKVEEMFNQNQELINQLKALFNNAPDLLSAVRRSLDETAALRSQVDEFKAAQASQFKSNLIAAAADVNGIKVISGVLPVDAQVAKDMAFQLRSQFTEKLLVVIGGVAGGKPSLTVSLSDDLVKAGKNAGAMVREAAKLMQGGGGGQPHFATAGGKNPDGVKAAVDKVVELIG